MRISENIDDGLQQMGNVMIPETAVQLQNLLKNVVGLENILWAQIAAKGRRDRDEVRSNKTRGTEGRERAAGGDRPSGKNGCDQGRDELLEQLVIDRFLCRILLILHII